MPGSDRSRRQWPSRAPNAEAADLGFCYATDGPGPQIQNRVLWDERGFLEAGLQKEDGSVHMLAPPLPSRVSGAGYLVSQCTRALRQSIPILGIPKGKMMHPIHDFKKEEKLF